DIEDRDFVVARGVHRSDESAVVTPVRDDDEVVEAWGWLAVERELMFRHRAMRVGHVPHDHATVTAHVGHDRVAGRTPVRERCDTRSVTERRELFARGQVPDAEATGIGHGGRREVPAVWAYREERSRLAVHRPARGLTAAGVPSKEFVRRAATPGL